VRSWLAAGADPNHVNNDRTPALILAVQKGLNECVALLLAIAFIVGALLLRAQADRIRPLDLPLPAGWVAVTADTVLAGISPQSAVRAARSAEAPIGATPRVRLIKLTSAGSDAAALSGVYWLIVTDDVRPTMEIPVGDSLDVIRAYVLVDQGGAVVLAVERGFSTADPTLPPD
jgi:ankyrin repeat protein